MEMEREVKILNLDDILPNRFQPRITFNEAAIAELAESIKEHGVIQPIVVRKISDKYEIIAGERRYKASVLAGKTTIPAIITNLDDKNSAEIALIENVQRQDLTPIEEAISYKKILDMGYLTQTELAEKLGKTQSTIANKLRLLNLSEEVQEALLNQRISERHARSLLKLNNKDQNELLDRIIKERLTVRKTDDEIKKLLNTSESNDEIQKTPTPDVEVLDLEIDKEEEKKMNEEMKIPTEKIIEPMETNNDIVESNNTLWSAPVQDSVPVQDQVINNAIGNSSNEIPESPTPGFVDVNKIEQEAKDIVIPASQSADLGMLLQQKDNQPVPPVNNSPMAPVSPVEMPQDDDTTTSSQGKFFNMFNFTDMSSKPVEDLEQKQVNMDFGENKVQDNFMFNFNPLEKNIPSSVDEKQTIPENETFSNIQAFNPTVESVVSSNVPTENLDSTTQNESFINNSFENKEAQLEKPQTLPPITELNKGLNSMNLETPLTPQPAVNDEPDIEPFKPLYSLGENEEFIPTENLSGNQKLNPMPDQNNEIQKSTYVASDMRTVINTIRDCAKTIENYGYEIDLDELDFPDSYQVTFKINKK